MIKHGTFYLYIVQCRNGTYYTGSTKDIENRLRLHNSGRGAKYVRGKGPVQLVYCRKYRYLRSVLRAERNVKALTRPQKEKLIHNAAKRRGSSLGENK